MLILSRRESEKLIIGDNLTVKVKKIGKKGSVIECDYSFGIRKKLFLIVGEKAQLYPDVSMTIVEKHRTQIRIGIDAPRSIPVNREEIQKRIDEKKRIDSLKYSQTKTVAHNQL